MYSQSVCILDIHSAVFAGRALQHLGQTFTEKKGKQVGGKKTLATLLAAAKAHCWYAKTFQHKKGIEKGFFLIKKGEAEGRQKNKAAFFLKQYSSHH